MEEFKPGDLVLIKSRKLGAEVTSVEGQKVTLKIATINPLNGKMAINVAVYRASDLEHIKKKKGLIFV